jgi:CDP-diacylglycerol--glycerol-3-phosphate 3-phosphatidyltransferase
MKPAPPTPRPRTSPPSSHFWRDLRTPPNIVSIVRVFAVLIAITVVYTVGPIPGVIIGTVAGLTDYLDGYLARKLDMTTELGALLDQVSDLLFTLFGLCLLIDQGTWGFYLLPLWAVRDVSILAVRQSAAQQGFGIPSIFLGKLGTNFIGYSFIFGVLDFWFAARGLGGETAHTVCRAVGLFGIHMGLLFQWISGAVYTRSYIRSYRSAEEPA